jgi:hypothetical protein
MMGPSLNPEPISSSVLFQNETVSSTACKRGARPTAVIDGVCRYGAPNCACATSGPAISEMQPIMCFKT